METQVLKCPLCHQPFQVTPAEQGKAVACPGCKKPVSIPTNLFNSAKPAAKAAAADQSTKQDPGSIFGCPTCKGQFGVSPQMFGQTVGCPHCKSPVKIGQPKPNQPPIQKPTRTKKKPPTEKAAPADDSSSKNPTVAASKPPQAAKATKRKAEEPQQESQEPEPTNPNTTPVITPAPSGDAHDVEPVPETVPADEAEGVVDSSGPQETVTPRKRVTTATLVDQDLEEETEEDANQPLPVQDVSHLLPERFDVDDPSDWEVQRDLANNHKVILPDGQGGFKKVDTRIVSVKHGDEQIQLIALTDAQRRRRRIINNTIAVILAIIALGLIFTFLQDLQ